MLSLLQYISYFNINIATFFGFQIAVYNTLLDNERRPGTATVRRHILKWRRREIQKWKTAFRKPRFVDLQDQRFVFSAIQHT